ncbi:MAG: NAD(P)/FAD-dependent oxidoreductase [Lentisphaeria bacterium]|nr:NAD(P)/FAD-dependent oxidoreductase [Lentisphaeria bacterium]
MKEIVIIGAGPAGLTAGIRLLQEGGKEYSVTVLEASSSVGGISRTVRHNGNRMDIGGHRFFSKDAEVNAFWEELMPLQGAPSLDDRILDRKVALAPGGPDPEKADRVMLTRTRVSRIYYRRKFFDYPVKMNGKTLRNMGFFTAFSAGMSYLHSLFRTLPEDSLENFYINRFGRKLYSMFFERYTEKLWGRHPREISADWGAQRVKGLSILAVLKDIFGKMLPGTRKKVETSLIEEFRYPKYGPGQLWETAEEEFERLGGRILFDCRAERFVCENGRIETLFAVNGKGEQCEFHPQIVISSMPVKDLVSGMTPVPEEILAAAKGLPYRDFVTVGLLLEKLALENTTKFRTLGNIVPDCWIYVQEPDVKLGRIQIFNNWSPYMVKKPAETVWIGLEYFCSRGDEFWNMPETKWKEFAFAELTKMGVVSPGEKVPDFHVEKVEKAYPAYFDTYEKMDEIIGFLDSVSNLYCVGRNGQHRYNNMDHSMMTAFAAVRHILSGGNGDKAAIWNVNTEKEYHEEKNGSSR